MRRALIVSPYFPPSTVAGVHRARFLSRYLPEFGWEPIVLCVHERYHRERLDPDLAKLVPPTVRVVKTGAFTVTPGVGDLGLRGYPHLARAGRTFLEREGADLVMATVLPGYASLLGAGLKRRFGLPFVLDYQDPWVSDWGASQPALSKAGIAHRLAQWLEPRAIAAADHVTSVSEGTNEALRRRYPALGRERCSVMPIGGDAADFEAVGRDTAVSASLERRSGERLMSHVGTLLPRGGETLAAVLTALGKVNTGRGPRLRLRFVGTSNQPDGFGQFRALPEAERLGVAQWVEEIPERVPYLEALGHLVRSDAILALGSSERHYTASKIFPALLAGPPVLAVFHQASSVVEITRRAGGARCITFGDEVPVSRQLPVIEQALRQIAAGETGSLPARRPEALEPFSARAVSQRFARLFERLAAAGR